MQSNRYVTYQGGPIKRLKSAMIRSVFDKGEQNVFSNYNLALANDTDGSTEYQFKHQETAVFSSSQRGGPKFERLSNKNGKIKYTNMAQKGMQVALPTYTYTTPTDLEWAACNEYNLTSYDNNQKMNIQQNTTATVDQEYQIDTAKNQSIITTNSVAKSQESYQRLITNAEADADGNQRVESPKMTAITINYRLPYQQARGDDYISSSQLRTPVEMNQEYRDNNIVPQHQQNRVETPSIDGEQMLAQAEIAFRNNVQFHQGQSHNQSDKSASNYENYQQNQSQNQRSSGDIRSSDILVQRALNSSKMSQDPAVLKTSLSTTFPDPYNHQFANRLEMVSVSQLVASHNLQEIQAKNQQRDGNKQQPLVQQKSDSAQSSCYIKPLNQHDQMMYQYQSQQLVHQQQRNQNESMLSSGMSQPSPSQQMKSKLSNHYNLPNGSGQARSPNEQLPENNMVLQKQGSLLQMKEEKSDIIGALNGKAAPSQTKLPEKQQQKQRQQQNKEEMTIENEKIRLQQIIDLEVAQRDFHILTMLKQQIEEDQIQMYDLTQGLQSGMIKVDPHYMNKAIIEKIKTQNERWNQATSLQQLGNPQTSNSKLGILHRQSASLFQNQKQQILVKNGQIHSGGGTLPEIKELEVYMKQLAFSDNISTSTKDVADPIAYHVQKEEMLCNIGKRIQALKDGNYKKNHIPASQGLPVDPATVTSQQNINVNFVFDQSPKRHKSDNLQQFTLQDRAQDGTEKKDIEIKVQDTTEESPDRDREVNLVVSFQDQGGNKDDQQFGAQQQSLQYRNCVSQISEADKSQLTQSHRNFDHNTNTTNQDLDMIADQQIMSISDLKIGPIKEISESAVADQQQSQQEAKNSTNANQLSQHDRRQFNHYLEYLKSTQESVMSGNVTPSHQQPPKLNVMESKYRGTTPLSYLDHSDLRPVKKFVNINSQTRFAKPKVQSSGNDIKDKTNKAAATIGSGDGIYMTQSSGNTKYKSAMERPISPNTALAQSLAKRGLTLNEDPSRGQSASGAAILRVTNNRNRSSSGNRGSHNIAARRPQTSRMNAPIASYRDYNSQANNDYFTNKASQQSKTEADDYPRAKQSMMSGRMSEQANMLSRSRGQMSSIKEMKGISGQQTQFKDINIEKLIRDKALNRHINGPGANMSYLSQLINMNGSPEAQAAAISQPRDVTYQRPKSMIPQQAAQQRSLRQLRQAINANRQNTAASQRKNNQQQNNNLLKTSETAAQGSAREHSQRSMGQQKLNSTPQIVPLRKAIQINPRQAKESLQQHLTTSSHDRLESHEIVGTEDLGGSAKGTAQLYGINSGANSNNHTISNKYLL